MTTNSSQATISLEHLQLFLQRYNNDLNLVDKIYKHLSTNVSFKQYLELCLNSDLDKLILNEFDPNNFIEALCLNQKLVTELLLNLQSSHPIDLNALALDYSSLDLVASYQQQVCIYFKQYLKFNLVKALMSEIDYSKLEVETNAYDSSKDPINEFKELNNNNSQILNQDDKNLTSFNLTIGSNEFTSYLYALTHLNTASNLLTKVISVLTDLATVVDKQVFISKLNQSFSEQDLNNLFDYAFQQNLRVSKEDSYYFFKTYIGIFNREFNLKLLATKIIEKTKVALDNNKFINNTVMNSTLKSSQNHIGNDIELFKLITDSYYQFININSHGHQLNLLDLNNFIDLIINFLVDVFIEDMPFERLIGLGFLLEDEFELNEDTLIPRPDTESVALAAIELGDDYIKQQLLPANLNGAKTILQYNQNSTVDSKTNYSNLFKIIDLGTGSGCLGVEVVKALADKNSTVQFHLVLVDISENALNCAFKNAKRILANYKVFIQAVVGNWLDFNLETVKLAYQKQEYTTLNYQTLINPHLNLLPQNTHLIVSNPPYLRSDDPHLSQLSQDPLRALVSGDSGLECYEIIIKQAHNYLASRGGLVFEYGYDQANDIANLFKQNPNYINFKIIYDLANRTRGSVVQKKDYKC